MVELTSAPVPGPRADDHVRGDAAAAIVMYADFTCVRCAVEALALRDRGADVIFRHFALRARHPRAVALAHATEAAARQGAFWAFHDALFGDQGHIDDPHLWDRCAALGLDLERFESDRRDEAIGARVRRDVRDALRAGLTSTPSLIRPTVD